MVLTAQPRLADPIALWVTPVGELAGVGRHLLDVARTGIPGWRVVFLTPPGPLADALRAAGAAVVQDAFGPDAGLPASRASLRRAIRTLRPEVVHTHLSYADIVGALTVPRGVRLVTTEHGIAADDLVYHGTRARSALMASVHTARLRRFNALVAVSQATRDAMVAKWRPHREVVVIPNGVDPVAAPSPAPGLRIVSLARLAPEKRLDRLVSAFAVLRRAHPDAVLTLAGTGELEAPLRRQVAELGLADAVSFPGFVDATILMADSDVLAQLSVWENCSYALLDAVVHGLGVVATGVGGNPEILPTRCLVEAADAAAVASALVAQGTDLAARPRLSEGWPTLRDMSARIGEVYAACR